jgi:ABC-type multidrug transport system ATPase subunit/pSer/pThr/pTyr-binding forkhead associated (FHA) protein
VSNPVTEKSQVVPQLLVRTRRSDYTLLAGTEYRIGRDPEADIVVADPRVSWRHAILRADGATWVLEDTGSTNGTFQHAERASRLTIDRPIVVRLGSAEDGPLLRFEPQLPTPAPEPAPRLVKGELLPSVDLRPTARLPLPARIMRIGRTAGNDLVVEDLGVSRKHAELRKSPTGRYEIIDLGSYNGTYVNGSRVGCAELSEADIISIGNSTFRLADGELRQYVDTGDVTFEARGLRVAVGGKVLLDDVTFPIPERCFVGVIGPSGAGKSTLLNALTGMRPANTGTVLYDNRDLYKHFAELRHRIGLVPQKEIMHTQITARKSLGYAAELRFPADTRKTERDKRVEEVLGELGLAKHGDIRAEKLSGGQQKRVSVALELLTRPSLLFLDEPTSGLDPGREKALMEQMRDLAHDGRTVIVVTHSMLNLDTCDRLLVLVPGGKIAYYGPPGEGLKYFGQTRWDVVFEEFEKQPERDWAAEFRASADYARYVTSPLTPAPGVPLQRKRNSPEAPPPPRRRGKVRQLSTLARRYLRVIAADRFYLGSVIAIPLILGAVIRAIPAPTGLAASPVGPNAAAQQLLMVLMIMAALAGVVNAVREIVKENAIYVRERAAGLSSGAYLASKALILGVICTVQAVLMTAIGMLGRQLPPDGSFLRHYPLFELMAGAAGLEIASMCLGLLVSTVMSSSDKAMQMIVPVTMVQFVFSGGLFPLVGKVGVNQLSWLFPARWGMAALASTVRLNVLDPSMGAEPDPFWDHTAGTWLMDMAAQLALGVVFLFIAWYRLTRLTPGRRRK